jgi:hypothetical protein
MVLDEHNLRKRITELQEYRRNGVTTALEAEAYETAKNARVSRAVTNYTDWSNCTGWISAAYSSCRCIAHRSASECRAASIPQWRCPARVKARQW